MLRSISPDRWASWVMPAPLEYIAMTATGAPESLPLSSYPKAFNLDRLLARIPGWNTMSLSALIRIGFEVEYRDRASTGQGSDAIVLSLDREAIISKASAEPQTETKPETSGE